MNNTSEQSDYSNSVAIVGMSCQLPNATSLDEFWQNLHDGVEGISFFTDEELKAEGISTKDLENSHYVKAGSYIKNAEYFDAKFFNFTPREAEITDPQHRLFLECVWTALEHAGFNFDQENRPVGVYAGSSISSYLLFNLISNSSLLSSIDPLQLIIANDKDYLATRVSYKLNLSGPSISVQSACSTSLVAVHLACQGLLSYECDIAIAGGVRISVPLKTGYAYQEGSIYSPDGHCRAFDADSQGTIFGSGVGVVILKRMKDALADGDTIHSVILGSAVNNDGSNKVGYTAPSVEGQKKVISEALAVANVAPDTVSYIETHGTGTPLGDPIEISALNQVFRDCTKAEEFCAIGSLKSSIGHLESASGVASLIKTTLMLEHQTLVPSINFYNANPALNLSKSPFYVSSELSNWSNGNSLRRAGVSSFGIGGTNSHVVLEESPKFFSSGVSRPWQVLMLSAKSNLSLKRATQNLSSYLEKHPKLNLGDIAYTLQLGRRSFDHRYFILCQSQNEACNTLKNQDLLSSSSCFQIKSSNPPVVFAFPGQGSQYINMGIELYQSEPTFRKHLDLCSQIFSKYLNLDLLEIIYPNSEQKAEATKNLQRLTTITQSALFSVEYALAQLWISWGVKPKAAIGHSIGEYVAACLTGVFELEDAIALVAKRSQLMQTLPPGQMLSVSLSEEQVQPLLGSHLSLASVNGACSCVVSGEPEAISQLQSYLDAKSIASKLLHTSHAFHSSATDSILESFASCFNNIKLSSPQIPFISNVTGTWSEAEEVTKSSYWVRQLRQTVKFASGICQILEQKDAIILEVGPGTTLSTLTRKTIEESKDRLVINSLPHPKDRRSSAASLMFALGQLWVRGVDIDWTEYYVNELRRRIPLPTYPFDRQKYWIDPPAKAQMQPQKSIFSSKLSIASERQLKSKNFPDNANTAEISRQQSSYTATEITVARVWENVLGAASIDGEENFFDLGGDSLLATQLLAKLRSQFGIELPQKLFFEAPTITQLAQAIDLLLDSTTESQKMAEDTHTVESSKSIDLANEVLISSNICISEDLAGASQVINSVLLTGATGYLGAFLLFELLLQTNADIYCLVRSSSIEEGRMRIQDNLESYNLWQPNFAKRIILIQGDLAQPRLGLSQIDYETIATQVDAIYHNGALVNFTSPYAMLKATNVTATREVLQLAATSKLKPISFTSSIAVFESIPYKDNAVISEHYNLDKIHGLYRGYAQSKWVSEKLIQTGNSYGLLGSVYRPGNVAGHSKTGICNSDDFIWRMMKGCIQLGIAPDIETLIDITPVDYVSKALVYLSMQSNNSNQIFHLVNPYPNTWKEITGWIQALGYPLTLIPYDIWQQELIKSISQSSNNSLYPLASIFFGTTKLSEDERRRQLQNSKLDCQITTQALSNSKIAFPRVDYKMFKRYFSYFIRTGFLSPPS